MKGKGFLHSTIAAACAALLIGLAAAPNADAQDKKVYRWVDEEGNVHYSESLPPDFEQETHDEMSHDGIVREEGVSRLPPPPQTEAEAEAEKKIDPALVKTPLPRDKSGMKRPEPLYTDVEKQQRMDRLLMLRYQSEDELIEAKEVEINQLEYDEQLLTATASSLEASLRSNIDVAGHRQRAGLEVKEETLREIAGIRARLRENERSLQGLKRREENIRETFNRDIERYRELVEMYSEAESG